MVRRSTLVYNLLKSDGQQSDGFSPKEILDRVSQAHDIAPGKGLKKQINMALRRGIDFGILKKQKNKYRFNLDVTDDSVENVEKGRRKRKKKKMSKKKKMKTKSRRRRVSSRKSSQEPPPRPRVMPPPNWTPKKRNLREEPIPKFIKHSGYPPIPL